MQSVSADPKESSTKRRTATKKVSLAGSVQSCATECGERTNAIAGDSVSSKFKYRRSSRITASELTKREKILLFKEQECRLRAQHLDERMKSLLDREDEAAAKLYQLAKKEAQNALRQLEEHFTCALYVSLLQRALIVTNTSIDAMK